MRIPDDVRKIIHSNLVIQVATSDAKGTPHIAAAKGVKILDEEHLAFENWFCFQTLKNIDENPCVALSLLRPDGGSGYQLIGTVERTQTTEMIDGYDPGESERRGPIPQAKMQLQLRVGKILELSTGPHSDDV